MSDDWGETNTNNDWAEQTKEEETKELPEFEHVFSKGIVCLITHPTNEAQNFVCTGNQVVIVESVNSEQFKIITTLKKLPGTITDASIAPDNSALFVACNNGQIVQFVMDSWHMQPAFGANKKAVTSLVASNYFVFVGSGDGKIVGWTLSGSSIVVRSPQAEDHKQAITCVRACNKEQHLVTSAKDGIVKIWQMSNMQLVAQYDALPCEINQLVISPDESLVSMARQDNQISLATVEATSQYRMLSTFETSAPVRCATYSPARYWLAAGCDNGQVKVFDLENKKCIFATSLQASPCTSVLIKATNEMFVGHEDGTLRAFKLPVPETY